MVLISKELFGPANKQTPNLRAFPYEDGIKVGTLASYAVDRRIDHLAPLFFDEVADEWVVWEGQANEVNTITSNAIPATGGTFTITVGDQTTTALDFDSTAAEIETALLALSNVGVGDVAAVQTSGTDLGDADAVVTLTWGTAFANTNVAVTANTAGLAGNDHVFDTDPQGGANDADAEPIDGFLWAPDEPHLALLAGETHIQVFRMGVIHADDVPVPDGVSRAGLETAIKTSLLREKGINVQGVVGIH